MIQLNALQPINWQHPLNLGLCGWFLAGVQGRTGGAAWYDLVQSHRGVLTNMDPPTDWVSSGRRGSFGALDLDGTNDVVIVPSALSVAGLSEATVSCWFKPDVAPAALSAMYYEATGSVGFTRWALVHVNGSGVLRAYFRDSDASAAFTISDTVALTNGVWQHCAATVSDTTNRFVLYRNGQQVAIDTAAKGSFTATATAETIQIGRLSTNNEVNGQIDDVRLWKRALSAAEIKSYYDLSRQGYASLLNRIEPIVAFIPTAPAAGMLHTNLSGNLQSLFGGMQN